MMKMQMIAFALFVYVFVYMANDNTKLDLVFEHLKFQPAAINVAEIEKWQNSTLFYSLPKYLAPALACLKDILFSHWNVEPIKLLPMSDVPLEHKQMTLYHSKLMALTLHLASGPNFVAGAGSARSVLRTASGSTLVYSIPFMYWATKFQFQTSTA